MVLGQNEFKLQGKGLKRINSIYRTYLITLKKIFSQKNKITLILDTMLFENH